jgi:23S rRNA maturation mini-RNase III
MAALEAVMGQLYLTVLVARLVRLHIVHGSGSRTPDGN